MDQLLRKWVDFPKLIPAIEPPPEQRGPAHKRSDCPRHHREQATCEAAVIEYQRKRQSESQRERKRKRQEESPLRLLGMHSNVCSEIRSEVCLEIRPEIRSLEMDTQPEDDKETLSLKRKLAIEAEIKNFELSLKQIPLPESLILSVADVDTFLSILEASFHAPADELLLVSEAQGIARPFRDFLYLIEGKLERPIADVVFSCTEDLFKAKDLIADHYSKHYAQRLFELEEAKYDAQEENRRLKTYIDKLEHICESGNPDPFADISEVTNPVVERKRIVGGMIGNRPSSRSYGYGSRRVGSPHVDQLSDSPADGSAPVQARWNDQRIAGLEGESESTSPTRFGRVIGRDEVGPIFDYSLFGIRT